MDEATIKRDLLGLTNEEAIALYYTRCRGLSMKEVERLTEKNEGNIFQKPMSAGSVSNKATQGLRHLRIEDIQRGSAHYRLLQELAENLGTPPQWREWPPELPSETGPASEQTDNLEKTDDDPSVSTVSPVFPADLEMSDDSNASIESNEPSEDTSHIGQLNLPRWLTGRAVFAGIIIILLLFGLRRAA